MEGRVNLHWDDEGVIPNTLSPDTEFLFVRMTEETLSGLEPARGLRVLDVGCGRGMDLAKGASSGAIPFGLDASLVMLSRAKETFEGHSIPPRLVGGCAEKLPFMDGSFERVLCKGAIDHFHDPAEAMREMLRVLRPGGRMVIAVANFKSLSCRLGSDLNRLYRLIFGREISGCHHWVIPEDHTFPFSRAFLLRLLPRGVEIEALIGVSLLWGLPRWGALLMRLPYRLARVVLRLLDLIARRLPCLGDVIVLRARRSGDSMG